LVRVISWFGSRDSSAKQTTKKHEHKTNPHEGRKPMSQVYYCRLNGFPLLLPFPITRLKSGVNEYFDFLFWAKRLSEKGSRCTPREYSRPAQPIAPGPSKRSGTEVTSALWPSARAPVHQSVKTQCSC